MSRGQSSRSARAAPETRSPAAARPVAIFFMRCSSLEEVGVHFEPSPASGARLPRNSNRDTVAFVKTGPTRGPYDPERRHDELRRKNYTARHVAMQEISTASGFPS